MGRSGAASSTRSRLRPAGRPLLEVLVVLGLVVALSAFAQTRLNASEPTARSAPTGAGTGTGSAAAAADAPRIRAVFVGDSFSAGAGAAGVGEGLATRIAERLDWTPTVAAGGGSGYVAPGYQRRTYVQRLREVEVTDPDVVVVAGSSNDVWHPVGRIAEASAAFNRLARERFPGASLVVIGVMWRPGGLRTAPSSPDEVNAALRASAAASGALFVDPRHVNWMASMQGRMAPDRIHPNEAGYRYLAERAAASIERVAVSTLPSLRPRLRITSAAASARS